MNDFGKPIKSELCLDCITVAGQAYCTMNCGPCVAPTKENHLGTRKNEATLLYRPDSLRSR